MDFPKRSSVWDEPIIVKPLDFLEETEMEKCSRICLGKEMQRLCYPSSMGVPLVGRDYLCLEKRP